jgi:hypothetical protein
MTPSCFSYITVGITGGKAKHAASAMEKIAAVAVPHFGL